MSHQHSTPTLATSRDLKTSTLSAEQDSLSVARCLITKNRLDFETENFVVTK